VSPACPGCRTALPPDILGAEGETSCPRCHIPVEVEVFPALTRPLEAASGSAVQSAEGESTCFYHAGYRAAVPCDACGRFLCSLCDLEIGSRHLCPECIHRSIQGPKATMTSERILWDRLALSLAVLPIFTFYFTVVTAPAAIFIALRHWRSPGSLVSHGRWRFVVAVLCATLQLAGWAGIIYAIARAGGTAVETAVDTED